MGNCTICEYTPGHCGFDPVVCRAIERYANMPAQYRNIKVLKITVEVEFFDGAAGYMTQYNTKEYKEFENKKDAVKYISDVCDFHEIK